jgi:hypothetical protein
MKSFGQEFYPYEAIRALRIADKIKTCDRVELTSRIASELPYDGESTRVRVAGKFIQRYLNASRRRIAPSEEQNFARLIAKQRHVPAQIELLFYELTKTDELVGAIARDLFYPVCIEGRAPQEYSDNEFAARNGNRLWDDEPILTRAFILEHAQQKWNFCDNSTLDRALRVLLSAGLIARERMTNLRGHPAAFRLAEHDVSPTAFAWALYDEYLPALQNGTFLLEREALLQSNFVKTFLLSPEQAEAALETARRHQLLATHGAQLRLVFANKSTLVDALLTKAI